MDNPVPTADPRIALEALLRSAPADAQARTGFGAIDRLADALAGTGPSRTLLDIALLLRQALRLCAREAGLSMLVPVADGVFDADLPWEEAGLTVRHQDGERLVSAAPWCPAWLDEVDPVEGVDGYAAAEHRSRSNDPVQADPFLRKLGGRTTYKSSGQKAAARAALATPPGGTTTISLPTGEGKSAIFQLVGILGFAGEPKATRGVTVVIVPTVALGINHEREAHDLCGLPLPLVYRSGGTTDMDALRQRIADGTQGLCFASPEAACGPLRKALVDAAKAGHLRALVVDEAHLIDQWGTDFRSEFQELSGLRLSLIETAPKRAPLRTILLSATLTDGSRGTLDTLFGLDDKARTLSVSRTRTEPDFWVSKTVPTIGERDRRVLEALKRVPRPTILYVTKVEDAEAWYRDLKTAGFGCIARLHGKTDTVQREKVVMDWRDGKLDLVVGTSAFGLGIDYQNVRSVVHACVPETLDRFYQEVGRGGRDGRNALSLIVPAAPDFSIAESLNRKKTIAAERGLIRWKAMFHNKRASDETFFEVNVDIAPGSDERDIDMQGKRNTDWNWRTLILLARAGIIRLRGDIPKSGPDDPQWTRIEVMNSDHLDPELWEDRLMRFRRESQATHDRNLEFMRKFLKDDRCASALLADLYGRGDTTLACSRCRQCRKVPGCRVHGRGRERCLPEAPPPPPDMGALVGSTDGLCLVPYTMKNLDEAGRQRLYRALEALCDRGLCAINLVDAPARFIGVVEKIARERAVLVDKSRIDDLLMGGLFAWPGLTVFGPHSGLRLGKVRGGVASPDRPRLVFVSQGQKDETGRDLVQASGMRTHGYDEFLRRVMR